MASSFFNDLFSLNPANQRQAPAVPEMSLSDIVSRYQKTGNAGDIAAEIDRTRNASRAEEPALRSGEGWRALLDWGLSTMAAGGKPGATLLGAIGEGGQAATSAAEARQGKRQSRKDELSQQMINDILLGQKMASGEREFKYQAEQDSILNALRERGYDLDELKLNRPDNELIQNADGEYVLVNTNTAPGSTGVSGLSPRDKMIMELQGKAITDPNAYDDESKAANARMIEELLGGGGGGGGGPTLKPGTIDSGYKYLGGDPANPNSWEKVR